MKLNMIQEMQALLNSKFILGWSWFNAGLISIDSQWLGGVVLDSLQISPFFTNLYMGMFTVYYVGRIYWFWIDKSLNKREREQELKNNKKDYYYGTKKT